jgi:squalene-associated FAD-dependent desaturase
MKSPLVIVIGGGFAGLSAATAIAEAGVAVHVLEARPGLGGRAAAFRDPATGERIDNGQHILAGCYTETLVFLNRIGAANRVHRPSTLRVPMIDDYGHRNALVLPPLPSPIDLLAGILAWDGLSISDRLSVLRLGHVLRGSEWPAPEATVRQWLDQHGQSARLCHMLWDPLALAALNQSADDATAGPFVAVLRRMFGDQPDAATLLLPAVPLDDLYVHPASDFLRHAGSTVSTNAPAGIVVEQARVTGVRVRDTVMPASIVVCAVPWFAFEDAFEHMPEAIRAVGRDATALASSPIVTVNLWFDDAGLDEPFVGLPGRTFQWAFDRRRLVRSQSHVSLVSSGADGVVAAANADLVSLAHREIGTAMPSLGRARLRHASVVRERRATFSLRPGGPPRPPTVTPIGGLILAGDWIDTGLPGTIESAVLAGHRAARAALALVN